MFTFLAHFSTISLRLGRRLRREILRAESKLEDLPVGLLASARFSEYIFGFLASCRVALSREDVGSE